MRKNPTPREIVLRTALINAGAITLLVGIGYFSKLFGDVNEALFLLPLVVFGVSYMAIYVAMERFIYRKIKLIYKSISSQKTPRIDAKPQMELDTDILTEVEQEVLDWADVRSREIENLRASAEYRKEFLGDVSHELKTPIFSIQGYLDTLLEGGLEDPRVNRRYLHKASNNVDRMIAIVQDLENISQLESGQLALQQNDFELRELIVDVVEAIEEFAAKSDVKISFKSGLQRSLRVKADSNRIRQVLVNFLTNAIRYSKPEGGEVQIGFYDMSDRVLIEVSDNGIGIAPEHLSRVFERFFRADKARSREKGGTGLGLAIAKHIVEAHGHSVHVRSTESVGSTFGFTLSKVS